MAAKLQNSSSPFRRGKSKVFYQSESDPTRNGHVAIFKVSRIPSAPEDRELPSGPSEEDRGSVPASPDASGCSPRRTPSHKSQDSGFSDSGESGSCGGSFSRERKEKCSSLKDSLMEFRSDGEEEESNLSKKMYKLSLSCGDDLDDGRSNSMRYQKRIPYRGKIDMSISNSSDDDDEVTVGNRQSLAMAVAGSLKCGAESEDGALKSYLNQSVQRDFSDISSSTSCWLQEVRSSTDMECTNMLQNKAIARNFSHLVAMSTRNTRDNVRYLQAKAHGINLQVEKLLRKIGNRKFRHFCTGLKRLRDELNGLISDYNAINGKNGSKNEVEFYTKLAMDDCTCLIHKTKNIITNEVYLEDLKELFKKFHSDFSRVMDVILSEEIKIIIDSIDNPVNNYSLKISIFCLSNLALNGDYNCRLITKNGGIRSLLTICIDSKYSELRIQALRALATVCCIVEAISQLAESGGVECVTEILCDPGLTELEKSEAAGVIAQITSPWIEHNHYIKGLSENLVNLIQSITGLAEHTKCEEVFLLASAALANITFLDTKACYCLRDSNTASVLIKMCRESGMADSIFIKDQIATVLANMVAIVDCRSSVTSCNGIALLLGFLQVRPNASVHTDPEVAACERVQQKCAIALSRLCTDTEIAKNVIELQGIQRLVKICKDEHERNHSDAVLVACLAALRKIASACGMDEFIDNGAKELVEPRLLDSFLMCSSRQESYV